MHLLNKWRQKIKDICTERQNNVNEDGFVLTFRDDPKLRLESSSVNTQDQESLSEATWTERENFDILVNLETRNADIIGNDKAIEVGNQL